MSQFPASTAECLCRVRRDDLGMDGGATPLRDLLSWGLDRTMDGCASLDDYLSLSRAYGNRRDVVLMYHSVGGDATLPANVPTDRFRRHVAFLTEAFDVVDLPELVDSSSRSKRVALTFDDGFANVCTEVLPVLRAFDVPATVFVCPGLLGEADPDLLRRRFGLPTVRRDVVVSETQLEALAAADLVTVGNHTMTHPDLTAIDDPDVLETEVAGARAALEDRLGVTVDRFAYTYGPYDDRAVAAVRASHDLAVTGDPRLLSDAVDRHRIPRIGAELSLRRLRWEISDLREDIEDTLVGTARRVGEHTRHPRR